MRIIKASQMTVIGFNVHTFGTTDKNNSFHPADNAYAICNGFLSGM